MPRGLGAILMERSAAARAIGETTVEESTVAVALISLEAVDSITHGVRIAVTKEPLTCLGVGRPGSRLRPQHRYASAGLVGAGASALRRGAWNSATQAQLGNRRSIRWSALHLLGP